VHITIVVGIASCPHDGSWRFPQM